MATDRQKRSRALQRLTIESERARLKDPRLSQQQIRETYTQIKALQRADREKGEALAEQREKERQALAERRQRARDNRAATYVPSWDSPTHSHPAEQDPEPPAVDPRHSDVYLDPITTDDQQQEGGTEHGDDAIRR